VYIFDVNVGIANERYAQIAMREIQTGALREPIWNQALADADGETTAAERAYIEMRVGQMLLDESEQEQSIDRQKQLRQYHDSFAPSFLGKNALLAMGVILSLTLGLVWIIAGR